MADLPGGVKDGDYITVYRMGFPWFRFNIFGIKPRDRHLFNNAADKNGNLNVIFSPPFAKAPVCLDARVVWAAGATPTPTNVEVQDLTANGCTLKAFKAKKNISVLLVNTNAAAYDPFANASIQAVFEEDR